MPEPVKLCSKCKINPRYDADSNNPWCLDCRTKYQREYQATLLEKQGGKGFGKGVDAMRRAVAHHFDGFGMGMFTGIEIAQKVMELSPPAQKAGEGE